MKRHPFYLRWAGAFLLLVAVAFAPKYWLPLTMGQFDMPPDIHWHAVFTSLWILIFFFQSLLINRRKVRLHQLLGYLSLGITLGVLISGFFVSLGLVERALASNNAGAKPLLLVNLLDLLMFGTLYTFGILNRRNPLLHQRLMSITAIVLLNAAIFRIGRMFIGPGFSSVLLAIFLTSGILFLFVWLEKRHSQQPNRKIWRIVIAIMVIHAIRIPLAITPIWADITDMLMEVFA
ncbi:MAG: hypothetical protein AAF399_18645 [Bacteroidota bacterium]